MSHVEHDLDSTTTRTAEDTGSGTEIGLVSNTPAAERLQTDEQQHEFSRKGGKVCRRSWELSDCVWASGCSHRMLLKLQGTFYHRSTREDWAPSSSLLQPGESPVTFILFSTKMVELSSFGFEQTKGTASVSHCRVKKLTSYTLASQICIGEHIHTHSYTHKGRF